MPTEDKSGPTASRPASGSCRWSPSRDQRFGLWVGGVVLTLGSPFALLLISPSYAPVMADALALAGLGLLLLLLATTPADAIKLPRWASWIIIAIGGAWMIGMRLAPPGLRDASGTTVNSITGALLLGGIYTGIVLLAIGTAWGVRQVTGMLRPSPRHTANGAPSPWRVVLYAWHPALPIVATGSAGLLSQPGSLVPALLATVAILLAALAADLAARQSPRPPLSFTLFIISAAIVLAIHLVL